MVQMIWMPGQRGTTDNETADQLAKTECSCMKDRIFDFQFTCAFCVLFSFFLY